MTTAPQDAPSPAITHPVRVGAVSYLNTLPLIEGLDKAEGVSLTRGAPSRLIERLNRDELDVALCPVVEAPRAPEPLALLTVGMIGSDGPTYTVRLYSACPPERIEEVHADSESRTSIALLRIVLGEQYGVEPRIVDFNARERVASGGEAAEWPETMLLIGDKVVTDSPPAVRYPHQIDLGEAWKALTGLPFLYAAWMCRASRANDPAIRAAATLLDRQRRRNATRLDWIATHHAPQRGWPDDLARRYLGSMLRFDLGDREREAVDEFFSRCARIGAVPADARAMWLDA